MINLILDIQSCTSMFECPFCEGHKVDKNENETNQRGRWIKEKQRTVKNLLENYHNYVKRGEDKRIFLKHLKILNLLRLKKIMRMNG